MDEKELQVVTRAVASIKAYISIEDFLIESPWLAVILFFVLPTLKVAGLRLGSL